MVFKKAILGLAALLTVSCGGEELVEDCQWPAGKYQLELVRSQKECPTDLVPDGSVSEEKTTDGTEEYLRCGQYQEGMTIFNDDIGCSISEGALMKTTSEEIGGIYYVGFKCLKGSKGMKAIGKAECMDEYLIEMWPLFDLTENSSD